MVAVVIVFGILLLLALGAGFVCSCMAYAISGCRFTPARKADLRAPLGGTANFFLKNSAKVYPVIFVASKCALLLALLSSIFYTIALARLIETFWSYGPGFLKLLLLLADLFAVLVLFHALCELPAAALAGRNPRSLLRRAALFFAPIYVLAFPVEFLARKVSSALFGKEFLSKALTPSFADVEIRLRAEGGEAGHLPEYAHKIISNAMALPELDASDVMLPRSQVKYFDAEKTLSENLKTARETGHSRYPLCAGDLDHCLGIIHIKDLFVRGAGAEGFDLKEIAHEVLRFKEDEALVSVLPRLLKQELHMAFVEDEFGGIIGVLTLDDILEELVGEIKDEFDGVGVKAIVETGKSTYKILGLAPLHKIEDFLGVDFGTDDASTFGGLITMSLGRFPNQGERVRFAGQRLRVTVDKVGLRRVLECTVKVEEDEE